MPRLKQAQSIDSVIQGITTIIENRCSLSDEEVSLLLEANNHLHLLKKKKGKTNKQILHELVKIVEMLALFFKSNAGN